MGIGADFELSHLPMLPRPSIARESLVASTTWRDLTGSPQHRHAAHFCAGANSEQYSGSRNRADTGTLFVVGVGPADEGSSEH